MGRAKWLFVVAFVVLVRPCCRALFKGMNPLSGFIAAVIRLGVKNPEVHGIMTGVIASLLFTAADSMHPFGLTAFLCSLGTFVCTIFLLDALTFETIRERDEHEELAHRVRKAFRTAIWAFPVASVLWAYYAFGTQPYASDAAINLCMHLSDLAQVLVRWALNAPKP